MANEVIGEISPNETIQSDAAACMSAVFLSQAEPGLGLTEADVSRLLSERGQYEEGIGSGLFPARALDETLRDIGSSAHAVYEAREPVADEEPKIIERLAQIDTALRHGQRVMIAFPKRRDGEPPFLHYAIVTGFAETERGDGVVIMDPSDQDGGVIHPTWEELRDYVTPEDSVPVMAWGIGGAEARKPSGSTEISEEGLPGFSLIARPMYQEADGGRAIPTGTEHPSSVVMPTADISKQFNSLGGIVLSKDGEHPIGYPRFVVPPAIKDLSLASMGSSNNLPYPTRRAAEAATHLERTYNHAGIFDEKGENVSESNGLFWVSGTKFNEDAWQHAGLGISSRQAAASLEGRPENDLSRRASAENKIKEVIIEHTGASRDDIYLFPTGMAAIYWLNQALIQTSDGAPGVQFGFPYTDSYDQRKYGPHQDVSKNILDFRDADYGRLQELSDSGEQLRGLLTEYPSNPLLWTPDFERLERSLNGNTPIVVDDTIGTIYNLDDRKLPDSVAARVTSLTKFFSSVGDVMGGSVVLRPESPHYDRLKEALDSLYEDTLWYEDAEALANNSDLFPNVMSTINKNGEELAVWLNEEWTGEDKPLQSVYHPSVAGRQEYAAVKKDDGGYGGLLSLRFNDPAKAYDFFDAVRITKGPSLGTYYTLGCLYTLLAHKPANSVEKFAVAPDLVRISVGIEDIDELKDRFSEAQQALSS